MNTSVIRSNSSDIYGDFVFRFEDGFDYDGAISWFAKKRLTPFALVAVYVSLVFLGQRYMQNRQRYQLRRPLFIWNLILASGTLIGLMRTTPQLAYTVSRFGWHHSVCHSLEEDWSPVGHFWAVIFTLSKVVELADTAFVVLRKQPLFFLHWYHHCTVLLYCWYSYGTLAASLRWFGFNNACVHVVMYSYYALKSMSVRIPRPISMAITVVQLSQMVVGCYINYYLYTAKQRGIPCAVSDDNIQISVLMYFSYFVLFLWYFYQAYFAKDALIVKKFKGEKIE